MSEDLGVSAPEDDADPARGAAVALFGFVAMVAA